jgi:hypothetical protein
MIDDKKSTDPGLSAAERKTLRSREAKEAIADREEAQRALHGNLERLREERLAREAAGGPSLSGAGASGRHTHRKRPIFHKGPERANHRGRENRRRDTSGIRRDVVKPPLGLPSTVGVRLLGKKPT